MVIPNVCLNNILVIICLTNQISEPNISLISHCYLTTVKLILGLLYTRCLNFSVIKLKKKALLFHLEGINIECYFGILADENVTLDIYLMQC